MNEREITDFIFLEDTDPAGDIALVFGVWDHWQDAVIKASELYKSNKVKRAVLTHGIHPLTGENEGDKMYEKMLKLGISKDSLLLENKAANTLENVLFSKQLIDTKIGLSHIHSIVLVCSNVHARRAWMTAKKHFPAHIQITVSPCISSFTNITKSNWNKTEEGRRLVNEEVHKIQQYLAKGDIAEL